MLDNVKKLFLSGVMVLCIATLSAAEYPDPQRFESAVSDFEKADKNKIPPKHGYVVIGSSSIRGWHPTIEQDLAPLPIIARGFGGSNMFDANHYIQRLVLNYQPKAILLYEGDNDVALGIGTEQIVQGFEQFVATVHDGMPEVPIYFMSIKPSVARWQMWPQMQQANQLIAALCASNPQLHYIDVSTPMLLPDGTVMKDIFVADDLHMNAAGYRIWTKAVRAALDLPAS